MDLKSLLPLIADHPSRGAILAPGEIDRVAQATITQLRAAGETVIAHLPGHDAHAHELGCDRQLVLIDGHWAVIPLAQ